MADLAGWVAGLDALVGMIAGQFGRVELRARADPTCGGCFAGRVGGAGCSSAARSPLPGTVPGLASYRCAGPCAGPATTTGLVRVAGARWAIEKTYAPRGASLYPQHS